MIFPLWKFGLFNLLAWNGWKSRFTVRERWFPFLSWLHVIFRLNVGCAKICRAQSEKVTLNERALYAAYPFKGYATEGSSSIYVARSVFWWDKHHCGRGPSKMEFWFLFISETAYAIDDFSWHLRIQWISLKNKWVCFLISCDPSWTYLAA